MHLSPCNDVRKLAQFLKKDYANNLYFFTYLNGGVVSPTDNPFLVAEIDEEIVVAVLITPVHCSISAQSIDYINLVADQIPSINSLHVVGRKDYTEKLLTLNNGIERDVHYYSLCELSAGILYCNPLPLSTQAPH